MAHTFTIFDNPLKLFPSKVAFWPEQDTLFVADLHLGKSESHRKLGMYLPTGSDADDLDHLLKICHETDANKLIVLGDLFHDAHALDQGSTAAFKTWLKRLDADFTLLLGNHDRKLAVEINRLPIEIETSPYPLGPFWLSHEPELKSGYINLCGHLHPGMSFKDAAGCNHRTKAFWKSPGQLVFPAFGSTTSLGNANTKPGDILYLCADNSLIEVKR